MKNGTGSDKANARDDLCRNASVISDVLDGEFIREQRVHSCAEADEKISAKAGWPVLKLALQSDQAAKNGCQDEARDRNTDHG
jgi:hypothetical protein